jgi:hypothetical protein
MLYVPVVPTVMKIGEPVKAYEPIEKSLPNRSGGNRCAEATYFPYLA